MSPKSPSSAAAGCCLRFLDELFAGLRLAIAALYFHSLVVVLRSSEGGRVDATRRRGRAT